MKNYENFCLVLENLKDIYLYEEPFDNVIMTGLVAVYKNCFEQSWKAIKEVLTAHGIEESQMGSPKQILKFAYKVGMVKNKELWLNALVSRNNAAYAYDRDIALGIIKLTKDEYYHMFVELKNELAKNWI